MKLVFGWTQSLAEKSFELVGPETFAKYISSPPLSFTWPLLCSDPRLPRPDSTSSHDQLLFEVGASERQPPSGPDWGAVTWPDVSRSPVMRGDSRVAAGCSPVCTRAATGHQRQAGHTGQVRRSLDLATKWCWAGQRSSSGFTRDWVKRSPRDCLQQ